MKDHPILFTGEMVRAIMAGRKTQTRRIPRYGKNGFAVCPYEAGSRLWVRETFAEDETSVAYRADEYYADESPVGGVWRPSIFMPRNLSRITLEIMSVRFQLLREITHEDAQAEGVTPIGLAKHSYLSAFSDLWDAINAKRGFAWKHNPRVFAIEFKILEVKK